MNASAKKVLSSALGLVCWQVRWDAQVGLDMNFGPPHMLVRDRLKSPPTSERLRRLFSRRLVMLRGTHWLVLYPGLWRLELADGLIVRDTSSVKKLDMAVARLSGEKLNGIVIQPRTGSTVFHFDLGARIIARGAHGRAAHEDELWSLHAGSRYVSVHAGGWYATGPISHADTDETRKDVSELVVIARTAALRRALSGAAQ